MAEACLSHSVGNETEKAYRRADALEKTARAHERLGEVLRGGPVKTRDEALSALKDFDAARLAVDRYLDERVLLKANALEVLDYFGEVSAREVELIVTLGGIYESATGRSPRTWTRDITSRHCGTGLCRQFEIELANLGKQLANAEGEHLKFEIRMLGDRMWL